MVYALHSSDGNAAITDGTQQHGRFANSLVTELSMKLIISDFNLNPVELNLIRWGQRRSGFQPNRKFVYVAQGTNCQAVPGRSECRPLVTGVVNVERNGRRYRGLQCGRLGWSVHQNLLSWPPTVDPCT